MPDFRRGAPLSSTRQRSAGRVRSIVALTTGPANSPLVLSARFAANQRRNAFRRFHPTGAGLQAWWEVWCRVALNSVLAQVWCNSEGPTPRKALNAGIYGHGDRRAITSPPATAGR